MVEDEDLVRAPHFQLGYRLFEFAPDDDCEEFFPELISQLPSFSKELV